MNRQIHYKPLELPFVPSASTPFLVLHMEEIGQQNCSAEFYAYFRIEDSYQRVRMTFTRCVNAKMLGFGGDAKSSIPIGEVINSPWKDEMLEIQNKFHPGQSAHLDSIRHFFICGHDVNIEVLAKEYSWDIIAKS